jgi:hypothetical protein
MCTLTGARSDQKRNLDLELDLNPSAEAEGYWNLIIQISFKFGYVQVSGYAY